MRASTIQSEAPQQEERRLATGLLAGAIGGLLGAWAMIVFADGCGKLLGLPRKQLGTQEEMDAAGKVVDIVTRRVLHNGVEKKQKQRLTLGFHYAFGAILGAAYGALAEAIPEAASGRGAAFGTLEWTLGNKLAAPRFGFLQPRETYSKQERLQTFVAHIVFGITTDLARRSLRGLLYQEPRNALSSVQRKYRYF